MHQIRSFLRVIKSYSSVLLRTSFLYGRTSYSQEGEDLILLKLFNYKRGGFYVDVGAHHPYRYSNTYLFYKRNWHGINIDANKDTRFLFYMARPDDISISAAISSSKIQKDFYIFEDSALNTFSKKVADRVQKSGQSKLLKVRQITTTTLEDILDRYMLRNTKIDFLNIDAEGSDFSILKSNNWKKYKPAVIAVETIKQIQRSRIHNYLKGNGYEFVAKTVNTSIFKLKEN